MSNGPVGAADDAVAGYEAEISRIAAVVAIVAHHEVVPLGNSHRAESPRGRLTGGDQDRMFSADFFRLIIYGITCPFSFGLIDSRLNFGLVL